MNRCSLSRSAACRIRASAFYRPSRLWVRGLFGRLGLPLAKPLPSTGSADEAAGAPSLFAGFFGTMGLSEDLSNFPRPFIGVVLP